MAPRLNRSVLAGTVVLAVYAGLIFAERGGRTPTAGLALGFYLLLVLNTYFSLAFTEAVYRVRCLSDIVINIPLVALYHGLPWLVVDASRFFLGMGVFFALAVVKYANWLGRIEGRFFLRRKIMANSLAGALCLLIVAGLELLEQPLLPVAVGFGIYAYGNVHTLMVDPLYREN
jgi:hypothetical protein